LFTHKKMKSDPAVAKKALALAVAAFGDLDEWNHGVLYAASVAAAEENELKTGQVLWPIRTALSGKASTPCGATEICELLGKDETLRRLNVGLEKLA
jgi:glutamyl-tRNA synthetase